LQQPQLGLLCTTTNGSDTSTGVIAGDAGEASATTTGTAGVAAADDVVAGAGGGAGAGALDAESAGTGAAAVGAGTGSGVRTHATNIARAATTKEQARARAAIIGVSNVGGSGCAPPSPLV